MQASACLILKRKVIKDQNNIAEFNHYRSPRYKIACCLR